jgi:CBS domain-containing protein
MATGIKVADTMRRSVVTIKPSDTADKALRYMVDLDIGSVIVAKRHEPIGIVTDSNLLERVFHKGLDPKKVKAKEIMTHPIRVVKPDDDIEFVAKAMRDLDVKRMPVVKDGKLVGLVSEREIIKISPAIYEIMSEKAELRGFRAESSEVVSGICESCGNYSENLSHQDGILLCEDCR